MAVPKKKRSLRIRRGRRSITSNNLKINLPVTICNGCKAIKKIHYICNECGSYK